jgi:hypothetical protein
MLLGYSINEVIGLNLNDLCLPKDVQTIKDLFNTCKKLYYLEELE